MIVHTCPGNLKSSYLEVDIDGGGFNGDACDIIAFISGNWVATQSHFEYGTAIRFCPFCGINLIDEMFRLGIEVTK